MSTTCPYCYGRSDDGLLCSTDTDNLVTDLRGNAAVMGVAELVDNLHVAQAKQARMGGSGGGSRKGDTKHERLALNIGAMEAARHLEAILGSWAMDVTGEAWWPGMKDWRAIRIEGAPPGPFCPICVHESCQARRLYESRPGQDRYIAVDAAEQLLDEIDTIRKHPAVKDLVEEVTKAVAAARHAIDPSIDFRRFPVGPCPEDDCGRTVFALVPAEDSPKPALMACYTMVPDENRPDLGAGFVHSYTSIQFYRTGMRIRRKMEQQERQARINRAVYGEGAA